MIAVRSGVLAAAVALACLLAGCADSEVYVPKAEPSFYRNLAQPGAQLDEAAAVSMISGYRANNGLTAVSLDPDLTRMAQGQAEIMAKRDKLDHAAGKPFNVRLKAAGYDAKVAAENIGAGYHTLAEAFSGWRDSPPHRENMLLKGATRIGIAAVYTPKSKYKVYWAMIIAQPDDRN
ncbi:MAG: CAP domain-containing protein [Rhodopseudomonas sp.]|nr:CAP domain-containing protein [Rhodopseudomonas sp.]